MILRMRLLCVALVFVKRCSGLVDGRNEILASRQRTSACEDRARAREIICPAAVRRETLGVCRVPIIFRFTVVVELRALATRCPCRSRVHHRRGAASTCVANAPIWVSHAKSHRLQHCRAPVQALVSQRVQRTRTSELMGHLAEAFCEHLMHGAAAARMSACMAKPAVTSCQAALSVRKNCTETVQKLMKSMHTHTVRPV